MDGIGRILVGTAQQRDIPSKLFARLPPSLSASDILATRLWGDHLMIFVTAFGLGQGDNQARLIEYSAEGERECTWMLPEVAAGLDVDPVHHAIYLAGSWTGTIYRLKLLRDNCYGPNQLQAVMKVPGARRLGPLVFHSQVAMGFAADVLGGSLYQVDPDHGQSHEVAHALGQPVALLLDETLNKVYVADAAGRRIFRVDVSHWPAPTPTPDILSHDPGLQGPSSLAFGSDGRVLVGDSKAGCIFVLDWSGAIKGRWPMPTETAER